VTPQVKRPASKAWVMGCKLANQVLMEDQECLGMAARVASLW
jgi:hypothetical protein